MTILVVGHTNLDIRLNLAKAIVPNGSSPVTDRQTQYGGTACNIAKHIATLSGESRLWSLVGEDFPPEWKSLLGTAGVDLRHLKLMDGMRTPTCHILNQPNDVQSYCMDQGAMEHLAANAPDEAALDGVDVLHITTGAPLAYLDIMAAARQRGIEVHFDPGQEIRFAYDATALKACLTLCNVAWFNAFEAKLACELLTLASVADLSKIAETVIVTNSDQPLQVYFAGAKRMQIPVNAVTSVKDATGAGDALRAGYHAARGFGLDPETSLRKGMLAAAAIIQHDGAQVANLTWDVIDP